MRCEDGLGGDGEEWRVVLRVAAAVERAMAAQPLSVFGVHPAAAGCETIRYLLKRSSYPQAEASGSCTSNLERSGRYFYFYQPGNPWRVFGPLNGARVRLGLLCTVQIRTDCQRACRGCLTLDIQASFLTQVSLASCKLLLVHRQDYSIRHANRRSTHLAWGQKDIHTAREQPRRLHVAGPRSRRLPRTLLLRCL